MTLNHKRFLLFLLILSFVPYLYISLYANPASDDFTFGHIGKSGDLLEEATNQYMIWSGRYTANFFVLLNPLAFGSFTAYKIIPVGIILLTVFSFSFFIRSSIGRLVTTLENYIISTSLC